MTYEQHRNPNLQWGYWLHADGASAGVPLVDEQGRRWASVRDCFWHDRLGFGEGANELKHSELERLLAVLAARSRRVVATTEDSYAMFQGLGPFHDFYLAWLHAQGLYGTGHDRYGRTGEGHGITPEGHAVLLMLAATRPSQVRSVPVGREAVETLMPADASEPEVAAWLDRVEAFATGLPFAFERREFQHAPGIALAGRELGGVAPIRRTVWFQSFPDHATRDRFLVWLAIRLDRWEEWGGIAYRDGGPRLTQHFLAITAATVEVGPREPFRPRALA